MQLAAKHKNRCRQLTLKYGASTNIANLIQHLRSMYGVLSDIQLGNAEILPLFSRSFQCTRSLLRSLGTHWKSMGIRGYLDSRKYFFPYKLPPHTEILIYRNLQYLSVHLQTSVFEYQFKRCIISFEGLIEVVSLQLLACHSIHSYKFCATKYI